MKSTDFLTELSTEKLAQYKTAAGADATKADKEGDFKRGDKRFKGINTATKKQFDNDAKKVDETVGLPYPGTYEQTNDMFKGKGQRRIGTLTTEQGVAEDQNINLDIDYFMNEGCGIFAVAMALNEDNSQIYIISNKNGQSWSKSFPYEITHVFVNVLGKGQFDIRGKRSPEKMANDFNLNKEDYSIKGPFAPKEFFSKFMGDSDTKPLYGTSKDIKQVQQQIKSKLDEKLQGVAEEWSQKYKSSINCSHPKGFSQKAHCAGKKKHNESIMMEMTCEDCGMCQTHGDHSKDNLDEACWKGYHKEGNKKMFGKTYPNCVKNTNEEQLDEKCWDSHKQVGMKNKGGRMVPNCVPKEGVEEQKDKHSESCPHCGGEMVSEELMNEKKDACYYKVKSRYKVWPSAYASGALVKCRNKGASNWGDGGKKNESSILEGIEQADESLHDWFNKEKWVRMDTKGNIKGPCAKEPGEGKPKCLPQAKAHSLGKKGRASAAARKRREDPNPDRSGKAINVNTKKEK